MQRLSALKNFDSIFAINGGLQTTAVHRLTHTMGELKSNIQDLLKVAISPFVFVLIEVDHRMFSHRLVRT